MHGLVERRGIEQKRSCREGPESHEAGATFGWYSPPKGRFAREERWCVEGYVVPFKYPSQDSLGRFSGLLITLLRVSLRRQGAQRRSGVLVRQGMFQSSDVSHCISRILLLRGGGKHWGLPQNIHDRQGSFACCAES